MKAFRASLLACAIAAFAGTALASSGSLVEFKPQVMPVVVQVDAQGRVTDILPSEQLTPWLKKMLVKQLDAWIVKPATVKGQPVSSRFIIEVAMQTKPRKDGKYDASFVYVKSMPLPYGGALHWDVIDGGLELALVSDMGGSQPVRQVFDTTDRWQGSDRSPAASQPAIREGASPQPAAHAGYRASPMPTIASPSAVSPAVARSASANTPRAEIP
ncbi:MAG: hypothetical protein OJF55_000798 [Rhodanobacteraceae bacterium]|jgi:hypothetical protein|nr:MAG: hypothetical protein OJF55_000798 [Rhodanobacteraceae bacterium]